MSTKKPRITITLEPHAHEVLTRLSAVGGDSMSQIVAQFVDLALPSLERLVVVLERARSAAKETHVGLSAALERAERDLMPAIEGALKQGDMFFRDLEAVAGSGPSPDAQQPRSAQNAAAAVAAKPSTPVPVTRGSGGGKTLTRGTRNGTL
jgi:hypothetical protein